LNTTFEVVLLASNVGYLFDRTPFYRPWLAWIGVDLRRLGVEDFVGRLSHLCQVKMLNTLYAYSDKQASLLQKYPPLNKEKVLSP